MPGTNRHTGARIAAAILAGGLPLLAVAASGCNIFGNESSCGSSCGRTFVCDPNDGVCRSKTLADYDAQPTARNLTALRHDEKTFAAAVDPDSGFVTVGRPGEGSATRVLGRVGSDTETAAAMGGDEEAGRMVVAWQGDSGAYRISQRKGGRWHKSSAIDVQSTYAPTRHFAVSVGPEGSMHLVFHSGRGAGLRHLFRAAGKSNWSLETVDDGGPLPGRTDCAGTDDNADAGGLGLAPDVAVAPSKPFQPVASYYDERCGDLRVAERSEEGWRVRVIDNGNFSVQNDPTRRTGDVGRFSSLAVRPNGNLAVAYQDVGRGRLLFASETDGTFGTALVDPGLQLDRYSRERKQIVGAFADLAIGDDGTPYIAYLNGTDVRLQLAYRARNRRGEYRWYQTLLGASNPTGMYANVVFEGDRLHLMAEQLQPTNDGFQSTLFRLRRDRP